MLDKSKATGRDHFNKQPEGDGEQQIANINLRELLVGALVHAEREGN